MAVLNVFGVEQIATELWRSKGQWHKVCGWTKGPKMGIKNSTTIQKLSCCSNKSRKMCSLGGLKVDLSTGMSLSLKEATGKTLIDRRGFEHGFRGGTTGKNLSRDAKHAAHEYQSSSSTLRCHLTPIRIALVNRCCPKSPSIC